MSAAAFAGWGGSLSSDDSDTRPPMRMDYRQRAGRPTDRHNIHNALAIAEYCRTGVPTVEWLMAEFGMCRASAYRWRRAIREWRELRQLREARA